MCLRTNSELSPFWLRAIKLRLQLWKASEKLIGTENENKQA